MKSTCTGCGVRFALQPGKVERHKKWELKGKVPMTEFWSIIGQVNKMCEDCAVKYLNKKQNRK